MTVRGIGNALVIWYLVKEDDAAVDTGCERVLGSIVTDVIERSRILRLQLSQQIDPTDPTDVPEFVLEINNGLNDSVHQVVTEEVGLAALSWYVGEIVPPYELAQLHGVAYTSALKTYLAEKGKL